MITLSPFEKNITGAFDILRSSFSSGVPSPAGAIGEPVILYSNALKAPILSIVTIYGLNFGDSQGLSTLTVNSVTATISEWSNYKIIFEVPSGGDGQIEITVGASSAALTFGTTTGVCKYLDPINGNDSNDGLSFANGKLTPDATVYQASFLNAGDILYCAGGEYNIDLFGDSAFVCRDVTGTSANPITITNMPGQIPLPKSTGVNGKNIYIVDCDYVTVSGFTCEDSTAAGIIIRYISNSDGTDIRIVDNIVTNNLIPNAGAITADKTNNYSVIGNYCYDCGAVGQKQSHDIYYEGNAVTSGLTIAYNLCMNQRGGRGIQLFGHSVGEELTGVEIHDNLIYKAPWGGILVGESDEVTSLDWIKDALLYNNTVIECSFANTASPVNAYNIGIESPGATVELYYNTCVNAEAVNFYAESAVSLTQKNNLSVFTAGSDPHFTIQGGVITSIIDNNGYDGGGAPPSEDLNQHIDPAEFRYDQLSDYNDYISGYNDMLLSYALGDASLLRNVAPTAGLNTDTIPVEGTGNYSVGTNYWRL